MKRLFDSNVESFENLLRLYIIRQVLASVVEFTDVDDVITCVTQQHLIFTKRLVAKTAVDRFW